MLCKLGYIPIPGSKEGTFDSPGLSSGGGGGGAGRLDFYVRSTPLGDLPMEIGASL